MPQTELEKAFESIRLVFYYYAVRGEPRDKLSKDEFFQLVREQLPKLLQGSRAREDIDHLFEGMDQNVAVFLTVDDFLALIPKIFVHYKP